MSEDMTRLMMGLQHPLRRQILRAIYDAGDDGQTPRAVADQLDQPLSNISYHIRKLAESELISLVRTEPVRGSTAHYYVCSEAVTSDEWVRRSLGIDGAGPDAS